MLAFRLQKRASDLQKKGVCEHFQEISRPPSSTVTLTRFLHFYAPFFGTKGLTNTQESVFIVALALGDKPNVRLRFDMAHELGHILLHEWDENNEYLSKDEFNAREKQANLFASSLLLPRETFGEDVAPYATNIEYYRSLRKKWGVSMQAMMYRARQLGYITSNQFQYMMRTVAAKGWRTHEPGDTPGILNSTIFQGAVDVLFDGGYLSSATLLDAFHKNGIYLSQIDLEDILGLLPGTLAVESKVIPFVIPNIKQDNRT